MRGVREVLRGERGGYIRGKVSVCYTECYTAIPVEYKLPFRALEFLLLTYPLVIIIPINQAEMGDYDSEEHEEGYIPQCAWFFLNIVSSQWNIIV